MSGHLWKLALVVLLSHAYRVVGRTVGPRWAGLISALPCSTAIALVGSGTDRGVDYAVAMADACWVGLAGASALPLAFASAVIAGWGWGRAMILAVLSYFAVMVAVGSLGQTVGGNCVAALLALGVATLLANRIIEPRFAPRAARWALAANQVVLLRTAIPVLCLAAVLILGEKLGPEVAGYLGTFPAVTLTALLLTHLETGLVPAVRMARALPLGNWAMVAFLTAFSQTATTLGVLGATTLGYVAAVVCLGLVAHWTSPKPLALRSDRRMIQQRHLRPDPPTQLPPCPAWPRNPRPFSPLVESIAA